MQTSVLDEQHQAHEQRQVARRADELEGLLVDAATEELAVDSGSGVAASSAGGPCSRCRLALEAPEGTFIATAGHCGGTRDGCSCRCVREAPPKNGGDFNPTTKEAPSSLLGSVIALNSGSEPPLGSRFIGSCRARCALTGKKCELPAHGSPVHRYGRTPFTEVAYEGQEYFPKLDELLGYAQGRPEAAIGESDRPAARHRSDSPSEAAEQKARQRARDALEAAGEPVPEHLQRRTVRKKAEQKEAADAA